MPEVGAVDAGGLVEDAGHVLQAGEEDDDAAADAPETHDDENELGDLRVEEPVEGGQAQSAQDSVDEAEIAGKEHTPGQSAGYRRGDHGR